MSLEYQADAELSEERREKLEALPDSLLRLTDAFDRLLGVLNDEALESASEGSSSSSKSLSLSSSVRLEALDASVFAAGQFLPFLLDALRLEASESSTATVNGTATALVAAAGDPSARRRAQSGQLVLAAHSQGVSVAVTASGDSAASTGAGASAGHEANAERVPNDDEVVALRLRALTLETECEATRAQLEQTVRRLQGIDQEKRQWTLEQMLSQRRLEMQIEVRNPPAHISDPQSFHSLITSPAVPNSV